MRSYREFMSMEHTRNANVRFTKYNVYEKIDSLKEPIFLCSACIFGCTLFYPLSTDFQLCCYSIQTYVMFSNIDIKPRNAYNRKHKVI